MNKSNIANLKNTLSLVCDKANSKDSFAIELIDGKISFISFILGRKVPIVEYMQTSCHSLGVYYHSDFGVKQIFMAKVLGIAMKKPKNSMV